MSEDGYCKDKECNFSFIPHMHMEWENDHALDKDWTTINYHSIGQGEE